MKKQTESYKLSDWSSSDLAQFVATQGEIPKNRLFHVYPNIPDNLLSVAKKYYAHLAEQEKPLVLVVRARSWLDKVRIKRGATGVVITTAKIYDGSEWNLHDDFMWGDHTDNHTFDLRLIHSLNIFDVDGNNPRLLVNGIPLFGDKILTREWKDLDSLRWLGTFISSLVEAIRGRRKLSIREIVLSYGGILKHDDLFFPGEIPERLLDNAMSTYARFDRREEEPLLLYNAAEDGCRGVLITDSHIFSCGESEVFYRKWTFSEIRSVWIAAVGMRSWQYWIPVINDARLLGWPYLDYQRRVPMVLGVMIIGIVNSLRPESQALSPVPMMGRPPEGTDFKVSEPLYTHALRK